LPHLRDFAPSYYVPYRCLAPNFARASSSVAITEQVDGGFTVVAAHLTRDMRALGPKAKAAKLTALATPATQEEQRDLQVPSSLSPLHPMPAHIPCSSRQSRIQNPKPPSSRLLSRP
jgi:hypothetical protein